jgi:hypothetical protein
MPSARSADRLGRTTRCGRGWTAFSDQVADRLRGARANHGSDYGIGGVVHAGVDTEATAAASMRRGTATPGSSYPTAVAKANAEALWPEGNDDDLGIRTQRSAAALAASRLGRRCANSGLITMLLTAEETPTLAPRAIQRQGPLTPSGLPCVSAFIGYRALRHQGQLALPPVIDGRARDPYVKTRVSKAVIQRAHRSHDDRHRNRCNGGIAEHQLPIR